MHDGPRSCACRADVQAFCLEADGVRNFVSRSQLSSGLAKCLAEHSDDLSTKCFESMDRFDIGLKCSLEVEEFCADVMPGEGRLHACLDQRRDALGDTCRAYISRTKEDAEAKAAQITTPHTRPSNSNANVLAQLHKGSVLVETSTDANGKDEQPTAESETAASSDEGRPLEKRHRLMMLAGAAALSLIAVVVLAARSFRHRQVKERQMQLMMI